LLRSGEKTRKCGLDACGPVEVSGGDLRNVGGKSQGLENRRRGRRDVEKEDHEAYQSTPVRHRGMRRCSWTGSKLWPLQGKKILVKHQFTARERKKREGMGGRRQGRGGGGQ